MACSNERSAPEAGCVADKGSVGRRFAESGLCRRDLTRAHIHRHNPSGTAQKGSDSGTSTGWQSGPSNSRLEGRQGFSTCRQLQKDCCHPELGVTGAAS
ncbi:hypothetical protein FF38_06833 [Lucilia cuprina]|uniref:Uncharacterized protein n=1 Tax=Lucilia cuprina TaxID=7375 RepID=A0A0L0C9D8_LUCCU|nr:hypothetical protein FF38_06833 [Lucilia cuprina]